MAKNKNKNIKSKYNLINIILLVAPFFHGLFPIWTLCLMGIICLGGIIYKVHQNNKFIIPKGQNVYLLLVYLLSFLVTEFVAIDKSMNLLAFFKNIPILLFLVLLSQYEEDEEKKSEHLYYTSISASISVLVSLVLMLFPKTEIFDNSRLQGIFFYANSYGLFLLVGLIILFFRDNKKWYDYLMVATLLIGIILTNSRAIIVMTGLMLIVSIFFNRNKLKSSIIILVSFITLFIGVYTISNIEKRVSTDMVSSSEFISRIIYYEDAIPMILKSPLGYGYEGFWYEQVKQQTAIYNTKFVHSSVLQVGLDVGIIPIICLALLLGFTFFSKKQTAFTRIILLTILDHSIIDIDFEYVYFILLILLFVDYNTIEVQERKFLYAFSTIFGLIFAWIFMGDMAYDFKDFRFAESVFPFHSDDLQQILYSTSDKAEQLEYANRILKYNKNVSGAYEALRIKAVEEKDFKEAIRLEKLRLALNKYLISNYLDYANVLIEAYNYYSSKDDSENIDYCSKEIVKIEDSINDVLENTNPLCYKTIHPPELDIPDNLKQLINSLK